MWRYSLIRSNTLATSPSLGCLALLGNVWCRQSPLTEFVLKQRGSPATPAVSGPRVLGLPLHLVATRTVAPQCTSFPPACTSGDDYTVDLGGRGLYLSRSVFQYQMHTVAEHRLPQRWGGLVETVFRRAASSAYYPSWLP